MTRGQVLTRRAILALSIVAAIGAVAAYFTMAASANGRSLDGAYCTTSTNSQLCISITWDGVTYTRESADQLALRPGTYWITVNDTSPVHNFALRSCPDSDTCGPGTDGSTTEDITPNVIGNVSGEVTEKVELKHGTYRLFCALGGTGPTGHEARGMWVEFSVSGVGQVDD